MHLKRITMGMDVASGELLGGGIWRWFARDACCIVEPLTFLLHKKLITNNISTVHLECSLAAPQSPDVALITTQYVAVGKSALQFCPWYFDFYAYRESDDQTKKRAILSAVESALSWIGQVHQWTLSPLFDATAMLRNCNLTYEYLTRRSWVSPNRRWKVNVVCRFELHWVYIHAQLARTRGDRETRRILMGRVVPEIDCVPHIVGRGHWDDNGVFSLTTCGFFTQVLAADFSEWMREQ